MSYSCLCTGPTGNGIKFSYLDSGGNLVFVYDNNFSNTVGSVLGPTGNTGPTGAAGPVGNGIESISMDSSRNLVMTMTRGNVITVDGYGRGCGSGDPAGSAILHFGPNAPPALPVWPDYTTPIPILPPLTGDAYLDTTTGQVSTFNFIDSAWIPSGVKYRGTGVVIHVAPSSARQMYATDIQTNITTTSALTKYTMYSGTTDPKNTGVYWPPPLNSTYFVCNEKGVYDVSMGIDYNDFARLVTGDVVLYVLDASNNYTRQKCTAGSTSTIILDVGYKIVVYTLSGDLDNLFSFDVTSANAFFELSRRY